jgi:hypothetical protein
MLKLIMPLSEATRLFAQAIVLQNAEGPTMENPGSHEQPKNSRDGVVTLNILPLQVGLNDMYMESIFQVTNRVDLRANP